MENHANQVIWFETPMIGPISASFSRICDATAFYTNLSKYYTKELKVDGKTVKQHEISVVTGFLSSPRGRTQMFPRKKRQTDIHVCEKDTGAIRVFSPQRVGETIKPKKQLYFISPRVLTNQGTKHYA